MKKVLLFAGVLFIFGATSCKKDYTCSCTILGQTSDTVFEKFQKRMQKMRVTKQILVQHFLVEVVHLSKLYTNNLKSCLWAAFFLPKTK